MPFSPNRQMPRKHRLFTPSPRVGANPECRMTAIAKIISGPPNMQAIPAAINNFKGQVFRGVINNGKNAPSTTRYPTEFGPAVNKLLSDRKPSYDEVIESLAVELKSVANDNDNVSSYFSSYASSVYSSATSFISQWTGKNGVYAPATSASGGNPGTGTATATATANSALSTCASKCNCNEDGCTPDSPGCCGNGTCDSNC